MNLPGGANKKKRIVGLAVTPNLGLEICVYNKNMNEVSDYSRRFLEYNMANKEIQDIDLFRSAVADLFDELALKKNEAGVFIVLPNVHSGFKSIDDASIDQQAVESMALSEAGESYVFKQDEPIYSWVDMTNEAQTTGSKYVAYTSFQGRVVDAIQDALTDLDIALLGVETSASAIPRAIAATGICYDVVTNSRYWDILQINPNGFVIFQMYGAKVIDYMEVPFAIMSFDGDEVYSALSSAVAQHFTNSQVRKLVIYSLTDNVSAERLKQDIPFDEEIATIDSNTFAKKPPIKTSETVPEQKSASMSLNVLGASIPKIENFATLNVLGDVNYDGVISYGILELKNGTKVRLTSETVPKFLFIIAVIIAVIGAAVYGALYGIDILVKNKATETKGKITGIKAEIEKLEEKLGNNITSLVRQISDNNKIAIKYYDSLSSDIPVHVWLTYYINKDGKNVAIEGYSLSIDDIYNYYSGLKTLLPQSDIKLNKLEVFKEEVKNTNGDADSLVMENKGAAQAFAFEISNTSYQKSFDDNGNPNDLLFKVQEAVGDAQNNGGNNDGENKNGLIDTLTDRGQRPITVQELAGKIPIPDVPDVEINLKEIK
ncbi:MAG: hypothetical protein LUE64_00240 [Candidatus Gastranaerophilales bacterium]|nr:hypothetical protein [Candidatus Gastranaerophilales bacterium]